MSEMISVLSICDTILFASQHVLGFQVFSSLRRGLVVRLPAIASDLNGNICVRYLRSSAIRSTQTASDRVADCCRSSWKPGLKLLATSAPEKKNRFKPGTSGSIFPNPPRQRSNSPPPGTENSQIPGEGGDVEVSI